MLTQIVLEGRIVRLEPLTTDHAPALATAAAEDRSPYAFTRVPDGPEDAERYVADALADQRNGRSLPWAVRRLEDDRIVGSTRFLDMDVFGPSAPWPPGVGRGAEPGDDRPPSVLEIGSTWYAASARRTSVNSEVKLLQLTQAFDAWEALRVSLKTDARNVASRTAIARLGAQFEGVRRAHTVASDGTIRDTAYYSIVAAEWPAVRSALGERLTRGG